MQSFDNMRILLIGIFIILVANTAHSQYYDMAWPLGYSGISPNPYPIRANLNFSSGTAVVDTVQRLMEIGACSSSISDSAGHLLMVSDACYLINQQGDTMMNGDSLNPGQCTTDYCPGGGPIAQGQLVVPDPLQNNKFWLFHETCNYGTNNFPIRLYYSTIDLSLDSNRGALVLKNQIAVYDTLDAGFLLATKHANGRFWWIVCHKNMSTTFISFLLTDTGLIGPFYQDAGILLPNSGTGNSVFSPNGETIVSTSYNRDVCIYQFNRCSGTITFDQIFSFSHFIAVPLIEFSPSGRYLYVTATDSLYQYDMQNANIPSTKVVVAVFDSFYFLPNFQAYFYFPLRAIDGKIYISSWRGGNLLHVINYPDSAGLACQVGQHQIILPCFNDNYPFIPNYHLGALPGECDSLLSVTDLGGKKEMLNVFPNPFDETFSITLSNVKEKISSISVYRVDGKLVFHCAENVNSISIKGKSGIYIVKVLTLSGKSMVRKMVKK